MKAKKEQRTKVETMLQKIEDQISETIINQEKLFKEFQEQKEVRKSRKQFLVEQMIKPVQKRNTKLSVTEIENENTSQDNSRDMSA